MNLHLKYSQGDIFTVDRENPSIAGLDTVRVDFGNRSCCGNEAHAEGVPENGQKGKAERSGSGSVYSAREEYFALTFLDQYLGSYIHQTH